MMTTTPPSNQVAESVVSGVDVVQVLADNATWADQVSLRADVPIRVRSAAQKVQLSGLEARAAIVELLEAADRALADIEAQPHSLGHEFTSGKKLRAAIHACRGEGK